MLRAWMMIGMLAQIGAIAGCTDTEGTLPAPPIARTQGEIIVPADSGPVLILPCGACTYATQSFTLDGELDPNSTVPYPISGMSLKLYDANNTLLATITNLNPSGGSGGTSLRQTLTTQVSGVDRAKVFWTDAGGTQGNQSITVLH